MSGLARPENVSHSAAHPQASLNSTLHSRQGADAHFNIREDSDAPAPTARDQALPQPFFDKAFRKSARRHQAASLMSTDLQNQRRNDRHILEQLQSGKTKSSNSWRWKQLSARSSKDRIEMEPPQEDTLIGVANRAFPPRMSLPVLVCDVKADHAVIHCVTLGEIEDCKLMKVSN